MEISILRRLFHLYHNYVIIPTIINNMVQFFVYLLSIFVNLQFTVRGKFRLCSEPHVFTLSCHDQALLSDSRGAKTLPLSPQRDHS